MNAVENQPTPIFQALGAIAPQPVAALLGVDPASVEAGSDQATAFAGYIEDATSLVATTNGLISAAHLQAYANLQQSLSSGLIASPDDTALLVDPTAATNQPVTIQSVQGAGVFFPSFDEDDAAANVLNEALGRKEGGLSVGYTATTQGLDGLNTDARQALLQPPTVRAAIATNPFSPLPSFSELANDLTVLRGAGHVLPIADLAKVHDTAQISSHIIATSEQVSQVSQAPTASLVPTTATPSVLTATAASATVPAALTSPAVVSTEATLKNTADIPNPQEFVLSERPQTTAPHTPGELRATATQNGNEHIIDENIDADGHILNIVQKARENAFIANQAQQTQQQNQVSAQQPATTQAAAAAAASAPPTDSATARTAPATEKRDALNIAAPDTTAVAPRTNIDQIAPVARAAVDWSSPWSGTWTPERAAGWPEGYGTDAIASGLTGLKGDGTGLMGMGLMGGKPNPALGGHIAKQLNVNVTRAVKAGDTEFAMRMDPPELGKVTVKLKFMLDGMVRASVMVERPETLELLQREARGLERAIEAGGNKAADGGISFSLDSGSEESAGKAFAEAMQEDRLKEELNSRNSGDGEGFTDEADDTVEQIDLDEILAHVTPETGLDVRV